MKRILSVIVYIVLLCGVASGFTLSASAANEIWDGSVAGGFGGGTGTQGNPYQIKNGAQLAYLAKSVNEGTKYEDKYIKLMCDIELNDTSNWGNWENCAPKNSWTAIGNYYSNSNYHSFEGNFDGDGHAIRGIYIKTTSNYQGLFGYSYGTIKNVGIVNSYISGIDYVGGVTGENRGSVMSCCNTGSVKGNYYVGGVAGRIDGAVTNCYNTGSVKGSYYVGGVVGHDYSGVAANCYNTGDVEGSGNNVGGVVGYVNDTVTNCYNTGSVTGKISVGGAVGNNSGGTVAKCYNTGSVTGKTLVGGVTGCNYGTVANCYYLSECAKDENGVTQYGIGNQTKGKTTADVSGKTEGLTDEQMNQKEYFAGFDFDTIWTMRGNPDYPYPELLGVNHVTNPVVNTEFKKQNNTVDISVTTENIPDLSNIYFASYDACGNLKEIKVVSLVQGVACAQLSAINTEKIKVFAWSRSLSAYAKCEYDATKK